MPPAKSGTAPSLFLDDSRVAWHRRYSGDTSRPNLFVRGFACVDDRVVENAAFAQYVERVAAQGPDALARDIPKWNGSWALVAMWPTGEVLAAVDRVRSVPLFFYHNREHLAIAASAVDLARQFSLPFDLSAQYLFLLFGYVSGDKTLYEGVRQIQSGEILHYRPGDENAATKTRYYRFYPPNVSKESAATLEEELESVLTRMLGRFRDGYRGEQVIVPLSGGFDSRLVVGMLKRVGIDNCLCFAYGDHSNKDVAASRQIAEAVGFRWRLMEYSPETWSRWNGSDVYREYVRYSSKGVSKPNLHDFPAVMQLADEGLNGDDAIYFPGHSADMNAGSHIPPDYPDLYNGTLSVLDEIIRHHASPSWHEPAWLLKTDVGRAVLRELQREAAPPGTASPDPLACCEMWNTENRQAKYIINSVRTYEFVGARWRTLWDYEFMDFFLRVPTALRYGEKLYIDCLRNRVFVDELAPLAEIPIPNHGPPREITSLRRPARRTSRVDRYRQALQRKGRWLRLRTGAENAKSRANPMNDPLIRLSGLGIDDPSITFGEALEKLDAMHCLAPEIQAALRPWLKLRLRSVSWFAVHTVLTLAHVSQESRR
jgi:asparagine synthase (glutamine-hydrolysing)